MKRTQKKQWTRAEYIQLIDHFYETIVSDGFVNNTWEFQRTIHNAGFVSWKSLFRRIKTFLLENPPKREYGLKTKCENVIKNIDNLIKPYYDEL